VYYETLDDFERGQREWLAQQIDGLTTSRVILRPSEWAETRRYLPPSVTPMAGYYDFDVTPYLKEILDCLGIDSPIREVSVMKGAQIGATVGVLENAVGYLIEHVTTAPVMLVTADAELAKLRLESYITPMIQHSGLEALIKSADERNTRKTGKTDKKIEWAGGGYLIPFGAQNANKLRSISIQYLLRDEIDGWPDVVGKDGDPLKLSAARTDGFKLSSKILDISTPLIKGASKIESRFERGDQRRYFVRCLKCNFAQILRWRHIDASGVVSGIVWELDGRGHLVPDSVRYLCAECGHPHTNDDKTRLLAPEHGAEWRPTAVAADPTHRSYHIPGLCSPVGMKSWEQMVRGWLDAWDVKTNRPKDLGVLQAFYNNDLGESFELRGEKVRFEQVSAHRRNAYTRGQIPNRWAEKYCGSPVYLLTCTVDVHADNLAVAVYGWCADRRAVLIDYDRFEGNTEQLDNAATWGRLRKLIEEKEYVADDGKRYRIALTLVDSGFRTDDVYQFCAEYDAGVYPVKGRDTPNTSNERQEFAPFETPNGVTAYGIFVNFYKDRWSAALRRSWDGLSLQPQGFFNAPLGIDDKALKELTVEVKRERIEKTTGKRVCFEWHRPKGANNELWDCLIYANAALDLLAWNLTRGQLELDFTNWAYFYDRCAEGEFFDWPESVKQ
jgi:phage terminase large subunit GpA-like protein